MRLLQTFRVVPSNKMARLDRLRSAQEQDNPKELYFQVPALRPNYQTF